MAKHKSRDAVIPTRMLPVGAKRIRNASGERVWMYRGREFWCKRDLLANAFKAPEAPEVVKTEDILPEAVIVDPPLEQEIINE